MGRKRKEPRRSNGDSWVGTILKSQAGLELLITELFHNGNEWRVKFICACGRLSEEISWSSLGNGNTNSCGCHQKAVTAEVGKANALTLEQVIAKMPKSSRLVPIEPTEERSGTSTKWKFLCRDCNSPAVISVSSVLNGSSSRCNSCRVENSREQLRQLSLSNAISMETYQKRIDELGGKVKLLRPATSQESGFSNSQYFRALCPSCDREYTTTATNIITALEKGYNSGCKTCGIKAATKANYGLAPNHKKHFTLKAAGNWPRKTRPSKRVLKGNKRICRCEYCGRRRVTDTHHINLFHKMDDTMVRWGVKDTFHFANEVINHPRNLIQLCNDCHKAVHFFGNDTSDEDMTKVMKSIKRFTW